MGCLGRCTGALARISKEYIACCPAAATRVKHQVLCLDYVFYIRLSGFEKDKSFKKCTKSAFVINSKSLCSVTQEE